MNIIISCHLVLATVVAQPDGAQPAADPPAVAQPAAPPAYGPVEEIVVTGSRTDRARRDSTAVVEVIDRATIEAAGAESVADVLQGHPGVDLEPAYRGYAARLQGLDPKYVLVLVDGERAQGRLGGTMDMSRFPADSVERIEIVKGAGSALYGSDAVAGVINIITRRTREPLEAGGHVAGGNLGTLDLTSRLGVRRDRYDLLAVAGHHRGAAWDLSPGTPDTTGSAFDSTDAALAGTWRPRDGLRLGARTEYLRRHQTGVGTGRGAIFDRDTLTEQVSATVEPDWRFAGGSRLRLTGHYGLFLDRFLSDQRDATAGDQLQKTREHLGRVGAQHDLALGARHTLTTGGEWLLERISSARLQGGEGTRTRGALFVQHDWAALDRPRLAFLPGLRLDTDSQFGAHLTPKLAVRLDPVKAISVRAAYGWGYRAPSFQELYLLFENPGGGYRLNGNPELTPEHARSANLDLQWRPLDRLRVSVGLFRSDIQDLIVTRLIESNPELGSSYGYANVAAARTQGVEAAVGTEIVGGLRADLSYTLTLARDLEENRPLEGRARHRGTFTLGYRHAGLGLSGQARGSLVGARPFYLDDGGDVLGPPEYSDAHAIMGLRVAKVVWRKMEVFLGADNLLGAGEEIYLPIAPRTFYGGLDFVY
jgi:outer membrane receptor for ferrienterochelin and colicins